LYYLNHRGGSKAASTRGKPSTSRKQQSMSTGRGNYPKRLRASLEPVNSSNSPLSLSNGQSVNANAKCERNNNQSPAVTSEFYLHKKFKKPTSTSTSQLLASNSVSESTCSTSGSDLGSSSKICKTGDTSEGCSESSECAQNQKESNHIAPVNLSSNNTPVAMVYKPKFRIASEPSEIPSTSDTPKQPKKISPVRIDRQSLDDRISKIIDENQSILAQTPEPVNKRMRNSWKSSNPSCQPKSNSQFTIMSGGFTTEIRSHVNAPVNPPGKGLTRSYSCTEYLTGSGNNPSSSLLVSKNSANPSTLFCTSSSSSSKSSSFVSNFLPSASADSNSSSSSCGKMVKQSSLDSGSSDGVKIPSVNSNFVAIPKKRRRLSPTPSRLCGGEVSELPMKEVLPVTKSFFQDVDMTVRVSNCSGAKVTIRTNNGSNKESLQSVMNFNRRSELPCASSEVSSLLYSDPLRDTLAGSRDGSGIKGEDFTVCNLKVTIGEVMGLTGRSCDAMSGKSDALVSTFSSSALVMSKASSVVVTELCNKMIASVSAACSDSGMMSVESVQTAQKSGSSNSRIVNCVKRPTFLPLRPAGFNKKTDSVVLPSPDTPRVAKTFNQVSINGKLSSCMHGCINRNCLLGFVDYMWIIG